MAYSEVAEVGGERVYVVGDIHGCPEETEVLLKHLNGKEKVTDKDTVIFVGDYIDRGPDSKSVIDLMLSFQKAHPSSRFLKGNHEDMFLDFLGYDGRLGQAYLYNGGIETIQSYGLSVFAPTEELGSALPEAHIKFLCSLESILLIDQFVCVHAGLNPLRELHGQNDGDIFWIREEFISNIHPFERTVIFGHTPHKEIMQHLPYKIGIDTGLVFGNKLSCVELRGKKVLQVSKGSKKVIKGSLD